MSLENWTIYIIFTKVVKVPLIIFVKWTNYFILPKFVEVPFIMFIIKYLFHNVIICTQ